MPNLDNTIDNLLNHWKYNIEVASNIEVWKTTSAKPPDWVDFPEDIPQAIKTALFSMGIEKLYSHQAHSWELINRGKNVVIVTGTASGKTLCYNLPVISTLMSSPQAKALYIFPTKALAQDQKVALEKLSSTIFLDKDSTVRVNPEIYDGDTPAHTRQAIRQRARIILSNPDMLHTGILPHHTLWANFFQQLRYIVIDEIHTYRGVFGSHVANMIRRLKRITAFYGASPQFILTSATIDQPKVFATKLIESEVDLIDQDGSSHGVKHFLIYNPPIINPDLGIRRSALTECIKLTQELINEDIQTIIFGRARKTVELILASLQQNRSSNVKKVSGYRSGYLPAERRAIETNLRSGKLRTVVATNALELGIDIGEMDASILLGYPGTIAATRQQSGRAGRKNNSSLAILIATADALDQFISRHPEYLFERASEQALINPDNPLILLQHLKCASFELPFSLGESFGKLSFTEYSDFLEILAQAGVLHKSNDKFYWMAENYPADSVSLRSASPNSILLRAFTNNNWKVIGEVDAPSAPWMVHPGAIYFHGGLSYFVNNLDLTQGFAEITPTNYDYFTAPQKETNVHLIQLNASESVPGGTRYYGEIQVTTKVIGFRKYRWGSNEIIGNETLDLPPSELRTTGYWFSLNESTVNKLRDEGMWSNDPNNYGPNWQSQRELARARDEYRCRLCGIIEQGRSHHVHHITPFRTFNNYQQANQLSNLLTLCASCHKKVEVNVRVQSGLSAISYAIGHLAPFFVMCDTGDLGVHSDPQSDLSNAEPTIVIYDTAPAGIGLSNELFRIHLDLIARIYDLVSTCGCSDGCPSCVGPVVENGQGGKKEAIALLKALLR